MIQRCASHTGKHDAPSGEIVALPRLGARLHCGNSSIIVKRASLHLGCHRLLTKWIEVGPLKNMTHKEVINFVLEHIVHRFRLPQMLTIDQSPTFMSHQFKEFTVSLKIKHLNSSPYYVQSNGQAETSNKILIKLVKKKIEEHPRWWNEVLSEALWAHQVS
jgi:hypothetical protein